MSARALVIFAALIASAGGCYATVDHGPAYMLQTQAHYFARMCNDATFTYERGYNAGFSHQPLDTSWIDTQCHPYHRANVRSTYVSGYQTGTQDGPMLVDVGIREDQMYSALYDVRVYGY